MSKNLLIKLPATAPEVRISSDWFEARDNLIEQAATLESRINTDNGYLAAAELFCRVTKTGNRLEELRKQLCRPLQDAAKIIKDASDQARKPLENAKKSVQRKLLGFISRREKEIAAAEHRRNEIEMSADEEPGAFELLSDAEFELCDTIVYNPKPAVDLPLPEMPKSSNVAVKKQLKFNIREPEKLPRSWLKPDTASIREWINLNRDALKQALAESPGGDFQPMPGIVVRLETEITAR